MTDVLSIIQTISIVLGIIIGCGTLISRQNGRVSDFTEMKSDIKYIKFSLDKLEPVPERLTRVEASVASAHKRIDEHIEGHKA